MNPAVPLQSRGVERGGTRNYPDIHVFTGGPGAGKTTTALDVKSALYPKDQTVFYRERAQILKGLWLQKGGDVSSSDFNANLDGRILWALHPFVAQLGRLPIQAVVFDRFIDPLAYAKTFGTHNDALEEAAKPLLAIPITNVFFFEPVPFKRTAIRHEDPETATLLGAALLELYTGYGYPVTRVPAFQDPSLPDHENEFRSRRLRRDLILEYGFGRDGSNTPLVI